MSQIKLLAQNIQKHTLINNLFIDSYMPSANGDYVKVYIYLLRLVLSNQCNFTTKQLAKQLNLIESDVIRALRYWDELKVLEAHIKDDEIQSIGLLSLERAEETLVDPTDLSPSGGRRTKTVKDTSDSNEDYVPIRQNDGQTKSLNKLNSARLKRKPEYSMEEASMMKNQAEIKQLLYITERYLGKSLSQPEANLILGFVDWYGLSVEVVEFLVEYCASAGHRHMNYIEKVAIDWSEQGIQTVEQAKVYTEKFNKNYYRIFKALGVANRQPNAPQIKLMDKWIDDYNFAIEVVEMACERTIEAINEPKMSYVDSILTSWHDNGAKSVIDIEKLDVVHKQNKKGENKPNSNQGQKKNNRFHNHDQRTYDYDSLEKQMNDMLDKEINEKRS